MDETSELHREPEVISAWQSQVETRAAAVVTAASTMVADRAGLMVHYRRKLKKEPVGEVEQEG